MGETLIQLGMPHDWVSTSISCWDIASDSYLLQLLECLLHCNRFPPSSHPRSSLLGTCTGNYRLCWRTYACMDFWWSIHQYLANIHMKIKHISDMDCACQQFEIQKLVITRPKIISMDGRLCYLGIRQHLAGMDSPQIPGSNCSGNQFHLMSCSSRYSPCRHMMWSVLPLHSCHHL